VRFHLIPTGSSVLIWSSDGSVKLPATRADTALYEAKRPGKNRVIGQSKPTLRGIRES
jgi:hypothetical protein